MKKSGDGTEYLTTPEAGAYLGKSAAWLNLARRFNIGPDFVRQGRNRGRIFYTRAALDAFAAEKSEA